MKKGEQIIIFSDLDGTLIDKNTYSFFKARKALNLIKKKNIPLVIVTSKTRAEIEVYRKKLGNKHPFVSENGGAVFIPKNYFKFNFKSKTKGKYKVIELGKPYKKLKKVMKKIDKKFGVTCFYELSAKDISNQCGLSLKEAQLAKKREYDVVFSIDKKQSKAKILKAIKRKRLNYTQGGRYFHLMGKNNKGKAVKKLIKLYKKQYKTKKLKTFGFGDSKNDFPLFKTTSKNYLVKGPAQWNKILLKELR